MSPKKITKPLDIYVRVSDTRGRAGDSFISPKDQEARCRALALARGYGVGEVFTDLDKSGGTMDRPAFNQALRRIEDGISSGIIVARMDRFSRTLKGAIQTIEDIEKAGGYLIECDGDWDTSTPMGRFGRDLVIRLGQLYREQIADNWQTAKKHAVDRGIHIAPRIPPGYKKNGGGRLEPDGKNGETIKKAFAMVASGASYAAVAKYLNDRELPSWHKVRGKKGLVQEAITWQPNRIKRLLENRVYLGEARSGNGHTKEGAHEALVSPETWTLAQRQKERREPTAKSSALLAGLIRCAGCSHAMRPQSQARDLEIYRCMKHSAGGTCEETSVVSRKPIDEYVLSQFLAHIEAEADQVVDDETESLVAAAVEAEHAYRAILENAELARALGPVDHGRLAVTYRQKWEEAQANIPDTRSVSGAGNVSLAKLVADLQDAGNVDGLRELLGSAMQAVFVRRAASRARNLPFADRVHIVWQGEEELELPTRGETFGIRQYSW